MSVITNETMKTLLERRSVRKFKAETITEDELQTILEAGIWAPSGMNMQSCHLVVIRTPEIREELFAAAKAFPNRGGNPFYDAPVVVVAFANKNACTPAQDAALAIGNMANAAASIGVASCWINCAKDLFETPEGKVLRTKLLPEEDFIPIGSLALGYADETPAPKPRNEGRVSFF